MFIISCLLFHPYFFLSVTMSCPALLLCLSWRPLVEKVAVLCRFLDIGSVTKNHLLKYSLAHAFCCFLASVEDVKPAVATSARLLLDTIKRTALQVTHTHTCMHTHMHTHTYTLMHACQRSLLIEPQNCTETNLNPHMSCISYCKTNKD